MKRTSLLFCTFTILCVLTFLIYAKKEETKLQEEPYFTEYHLTEHEMGYLVYNFHFICRPDLSEDYDMTKYPDYSYYELTKSTLTEKSVFVLNFMLFVEKSENDADAIQYASELGLSPDSPVTVDWVTRYPKEAVSLMEKLSDQGDFFLQKRKVEYVYSVWQDRDTIPEIFRKE